MTTTTSNNPAVQAILSGTAPHQARLAAASGLLPLAQTELLEVLVALRHSDDSEIAEAARETLQSQSPEDLLTAAKDSETSPAVLDYLATRTGDSRAVHEAIILNHKTSDEAVASLAASTSDSSLLDLIV